MTQNKFFLLVGIVWIVFTIALHVVVLYLST